MKLKIIHTSFFVTTFPILLISMHPTCSYSQIRRRLQNALKATVYVSINFTTIQRYLIVTTIIKVTVPRQWNIHKKVTAIQQLLSSNGHMLVQQ